MAKSRRSPAGRARARTDAGGHSVRRLSLLIERRVRKGTEWAIFEPNGPELWARIAAAVEQVLEDLFEEGSLAGTSPTEAYFVRCGMALNAQSEIDEGSVNIVVGFAPLEPAEFVIVSIQLLLGQGEP